jgi:hypothetical protein
MYFLLHMMNSKLIKMMYFNILSQSKKTQNLFGKNLGE